jgi:hypothetical protein
VGVISFLVGCGFQSTAMNTSIDAGNQPDASIDAGTTAGSDAMIDAQVCFGSGLVKVCLDSAPSNPVSYSGASTIDTSNAAACTKTFANPGGPELCVIAGTSITVNGTLTATGSRALVLIGATTVSVPGTLDVSSAINVNPRRGAAANSGACANPGNPENDAGGAGGGAGVEGLMLFVCAPAVRQQSVSANAVARMISFISRISPPNQSVCFKKSRVRASRGSRRTCSLSPNSTAWPDSM